MMHQRGYNPSEKPFGNPTPPLPTGRGEYPPDLDSSAVIKTRKEGNFRQPERKTLNKGGIRMTNRQVRLLSYEYPNIITLLIKSKKYTYESSEFFCRKFMAHLDKGAQFNALNWFKRASKIIEKEGWK